MHNNIFKWDTQFEVTFYSFNFIFHLNYYNYNFIFHIILFKYLIKKSLEQEQFHYNKNNISEILV